MLTTIAAGSGAEAVSALVEGFAMGGYVPPRWSAKETLPTRRPRARSRWPGPPMPRVRRRRPGPPRWWPATWAVTPSNIKNPAWMAAQARTLARRCGLGVRVWSDADLWREGFGGLLAVGAGSATPPRLVQLDWEPEGATAKTPRVVLVGKGITFDTGGLDIKPAEGMLAMKTDMSARRSCSPLAACRDLAVPVRVTGLLALAENAVGAASYRPGDVITHGGRTVEIGNTDAEGRLVLADALAYADRTSTPTSSWTSPPSPARHA